jgi:hypothetical protein
MSALHFLPRRLILGIATLILFGAFVFVFGITAAFAQTIPASELGGYAWSSNIGWISLNCKTGDASGGDICSTAKYEVALNADRTITGYAWSSNIGWIKFGSLGTAPVAGNSDARVTGTYPNLTFQGWARACAGTTSGDCTNTVSRTDGWDGWISLQGATHEIRTNAAGMVVDSLTAPQASWAWGNDVVGWIDMYSQVVWNAPAATLTGTNCVIPRGASTCNGALDWNFNAFTQTPFSIWDMTPGPGSSLRNDIRTRNAFAVGLQHGTNRFEARIGALVVNSLNLTAACNTAVDQYIGGVCAQIPAPPPTLSILSDKSIVRMNTRAQITWTVSSLQDGSCQLFGPGMPTVLITKVGDSTASPQSGPITSYSTFSIVCTGSYGKVQKSTNVEVIPSTQEI